MVRQYVLTGWRMLLGVRKP